jgi:uncharacterized membrane protein YphA (DoxX/SURF4 family)
MTTRLINALLSAIFLASGAAKLASLEFEVTAFERWGYPMAFMFLIGALEVAGGVGLLLRRWSALAAAALTPLMWGAMGTHLIHQEWPMLAVASAIMALSARQAWLARASLAAKLRGDAHGASTATNPR